MELSVLTQLEEAEDLTTCYKSVWYFLPPVGKAANRDQIGGPILSAVFKTSTLCRFDMYTGWHQPRKCFEQIFDVQDSLFSYFFPLLHLQRNGSLAMHCHWMGANVPFFLQSTAYH